MIILTVRSSVKMKIHPKNGSNCSFLRSTMHLGFNRYTFGLKLSNPCITEAMTEADCEANEMQIQSGTHDNHHHVLFKWSGRKFSALM